MPLSDIVPLQNKGTCAGPFSWPFRALQGCLPGEAHAEFESNAVNPEKQVPIILCVLLRA